LAFLDEDQPYAPRRAPASRRRGPERQQIMARRAIAGGVGLVVLILLILGIKGCVDARKQRGLENFFDELKSPGASGLGLTQAIEADSGTAEGLLRRAQGISAPGELAGAKSNLILTFELRRDGIAGLASTLAGIKSKVTGEEVSLAAAHMKELVASDVIYVRAKDQIDSAETAEGLKEQARESVFVGDPSNWLNPATMQGVLASGGATSTGGGAACPTGKRCGLGLASTAIGGAVLTADVPATVTGSTIDVSVQNQGDVDETNVQVSYRLTGGGSGSGSATIPNLPAGATKSVSLTLKPAPPSGTPLSLEVSVPPVSGERITSNNKATYPVTFG
jgi:hypothetical protein